ncbi:MAG: thiamine pyrophosphate-dependent enzyme [Candidatus Scatomorpha sp.]|jgi:2-oxoglutarate ferredoxin oxidoreductase subunit beta
MAEKIYTKPSCLLPLSSGFCPGCLHSLTAKLIAEAIDELEIAHKVINVLPVGCATMNSIYMKLDQITSAHGRAPAVATGIKRCRPDCVVLTYQGDGDLASIGLAEIMMAANRGEHITVFFANNSTYGMTGGQMAPTTLIGQKATTCVNGRDPATMGYPLRMCELIKELEAPVYVARFALNGPQNIRKAKKGILKAIQNQIDGVGFSFVEFLTNCPTNWGMSPVKSLEFIETHTSKYFPPGVFVDKTAKEEAK